MISKNTLNNMALRNYRKDRIYQSIMTDLALAGVVSKETAEMLLGYEIPDFLQLPDGTSFKKEVTKKTLDKLKNLEA